MLVFLLTKTARSTKANSKMEPYAEKVCTENHIKICILCLLVMCRSRIISFILLTGLLTFADGTHGVPRREGVFDKDQFVKCKKCESIIQQANVAAETARNQSQA